MRTFPARVRPPGGLARAALALALLLGGAAAGGRPRGACADDLPPPVPALPAGEGGAAPIAPLPAPPAPPQPPAPPTPTIPSSGAASEPPVPPPAAVAGPLEAPGETMRLSLAAALRMGGERNLELLAGAYDPQIATRRVDDAEGSFDTLLTATLDGGRRESLSNVSFTGTEVTREDVANGSVGVARKLANGGRLSAVFSADRLRTNSAVVEKNPSWSTGVAIEYAQPLLRGAGDVALADVLRARISARAADHGFDALTDAVLLRIETAYWELAFARAQIGARRASEALAESLLTLTQARFDARVASVLDRADARAGLEARRGDRWLAEGLERRAQDELRALILPFDPAVRRPVELVPTDDPNVVPPADALDPAGEERYVAQAIRGRPDLLAARAALETQDVDVDVARSDLLPQLDLVARLSLDGLDRPLADAMGEMMSGQATSASLGVSFSMFLGRRSAHARLCIAQWSRRQAAVRVRELENRAVQEVRAALHDLATARARRTTGAGESAAAREALDGEQRKAANGESTPFRVLEKEDLVTQAVTRENRAASDQRIATARLWKAIGMLREARGVARPVGER